MANWDKIESRGNVEDRRGMSRVGIGGASVTGILLLMGVTYLMGGNPLDVLQQVDISQITAPQTLEDATQFEGADAYEQFATAVLGSNNDFWKASLATTNTPYTEPTLVLFRGNTTSACGGARSASGPHYCPADSTIYLDETFFTELETKLGAKGGDVAEAYIIAHEVGHHVQNIMGDLDNTSGDNTDSVKIELTADCYAGAWAGSLKDQSIFKLNEITEAMDAASAVGDDNIQTRTEGEVSPESWTHGSSKARMDAFTTGYENADLEVASFNYRVKNQNCIFIDKTLL